MLIFALSAPSRAPAQDAKDSDWAVRCFKQKTCILQTGLLDQKRQPVAILALTRNEAKTLVGELRTPTGLLIAKGLKATAGSLQFRPNLITCLPKACLSSFDATTDVLRALKKADAFTVVYTEALTGAEISLPFSLKGFAAEYEKFLAQEKQR